MVSVEIPEENKADGGVLLKIPPHLDHPLAGKVVLVNLDEALQDSVVSI